MYVTVDYKISRFGLATVQSGVSPDEAIMLYEDLNRALGGLNLQTDLHLLYLVTPQDRGIYPDFHVGHTPIHATTQHILQYLRRVASYESFKVYLIEKRFVFIIACFS